MRSFGRRSHCLISCLNVRFRLRHVGANACKNFKHLRLLIGGQVDEFAAAIRPGFNSLFFQLIQLRIDRPRFAGSDPVDDFLQIRRQRIRTTSG